MDISIIKWNKGIDPPDGETVLVHMRDDSGDNLNWYTATAARFGDVWIKDNDYLCGTVMMWAEIPQDIMSIHD